MAAAPTKTRWQKKCEDAARIADVEVCFYEEVPPISKASQFEDDGYLHIEKPREDRACFDVGVGQSLDGKEQNRRTRIVMEALGLTSKISDRVLVEEDDEEEDCCPHCGR
jgi:hypothetical protein